MSLGCARRRSCRQQRSFPALRFEKDCDLARAFRSHLWTLTLMDLAYRHVRPRVGWGIRPPSVLKRACDSLASATLKPDVVIAQAGEFW